MEVRMTMKLLLLLVICCALLSPPAAARPPQRQKRVSDQRLAELETLLALAKMKNRKYVTLPVGFGLIDVKQIGRRKRSASTAVGVAPQDGGQGEYEYDIGDLISDLSSALNVQALKEDRSLEETNYPMEEANLEDDLREDRKAGRMKEGLVHAGFRETPPTILFGMRGVPRHRLI
ncbi:hypothetical protein OTU49_006419 [Cherax quadricarinatus]|uniref:Uncharacterized protein n=2 Tax=Cherax quadricarinatus TaxID=27406 RepID=A0AAW0X2H1_CHEQU